MPGAPTPSPDPTALRLAVDLLVAHLAITGTRADRLALHHDLRHLVAQHPALRAAVDVLLQERTKAERWRAYNRAEAAAAVWAEQQGKRASVQS